jgi:hypothetical protein
MDRHKKRWFSIENDKDITFLMTGFPLSYLTQRYFEFKLYLNAKRVEMQQWWASCPLQQQGQNRMQEKHYPTDTKGGDHPPTNLHMLRVWAKTDPQSDAVSTQASPPVEPLLHGGE